MCLPFNHKYEAVQVQQLEDVSYGRSPGRPHTLVTFVCRKCLKIKVKDFPGYIELNNIIEDKCLE